VDLLLQVMARDVNKATWHKAKASTHKNKAKAKTFKAKGKAKATSWF